LFPLYIVLLDTEKFWFLSDYELPLSVVDATFGVTKIIVMKFIATLLFTLLIAFSAQSQDSEKDSEKEVVILQDIKELKLEDTNVARLYVFRNYRVTKALSFRTKKVNLS